MQDNSAFRHSFEFPYGERYEHLVIPFSRIERDAPVRPGLYSWHLRLPRVDPDRAASFLRRLFHASSFDVRLSGNMRQKWSGTVKSDSDAFRDGLSPALAPAFFAIAYPLYIGISVNLRGRLSVHKRQVDLYKESIAPLLPSNPEADSDEESDCFGARLGSVFRSEKFFETENLYVKCVPWTSPNQDGDGGKPTMDQLRAAEWTCNTLFHPIFGRR